MTEYWIVARVCPCCAATTSALTPAGVTGRVNYGPGLTARAVWLVRPAPADPCRGPGARRSGGAVVSTGWVASVRGRAARLLKAAFLPYVRALVAAAPVAHADETTARSGGALRYLHVACTDYLTVMHVGDRTATTIDAGGVWPSFTGVLVRDGYAATPT